MLPLRYFLRRIIYKSCDAYLCINDLVKSRIKSAALPDNTVKMCIRRDSITIHHECTGVFVSRIWKYHLKIRKRDDLDR
nr:MAG TPA: hypothetical protein [Caudoviricetes sp.]